MLRAYAGACWSVPGSMDLLHGLQQAHDVNCMMVSQCTGSVKEVERASCCCLVCVQDAFCYQAIFDTMRASPSLLHVFNVHRSIPAGPHQACVLVPKI
eukprot:scaffold274138_cov27-Tisochrysis_lutea.AAC.1